MLQLRQRQLEVYLPLIHVNPVNPRAARERAFFPCYLFAKLRPQAVDVSNLQWLPGVRRLLEFDGEPALVSDKAVSEIKHRVAEIMAAGGLAFDDLKPGDAVRVVNGPFLGYEAIFDSRLAGSERVRILLEWIQRNQRRRDLARVMPVELNASSIEKVRLKR